MEQPNSGGSKLWLRAIGESWCELGKAYFTEATNYEWKLEGLFDLQIPRLFFCGLPLVPQRLDENAAYGQLTTPFQSGEVHFEVEGETFQVYLYPDSRKMTEEQYNLMVSDILEEASLCFDYSNVKIGIDARERTRELTLAQWSYIESSFQRLSTVIRNLIKRPNRVLIPRDQLVRKETVKTVDPQMVGWLERNHGRSAVGIIPELVRSKVREKNEDVYENRVVKRWLQDFRHLLRRYHEAHSGEMATRAETYADRVSNWLRTPLFLRLSPHEGAIVPSQVFRKHPFYRMGYEWFDKLYRHSKEHIGLSFHYPLQETYALYEIWCYLQVIRLIRKQGLLEDTSGLFRTTKDGVFLHLSKHNESVVHLKNGMQLFYQRVYRFNRSQPFYTYTQEMIPDIVLEAENRLYILDPKYRVTGNLGMALGEMHKYRDGILRSDSDKRAVESVFIVSPEPQGSPRYFDLEYHDRYGMGAIGLSPGGEQKGLEQWWKRVLSNTSQHK